MEREGWQSLSLASPTQARRSSQPAEVQISMTASPGEEELERALHFIFLHFFHWNLLLTAAFSSKGLTGAVPSAFILYLHGSTTGSLLFISTSYSHFQKFE